MRWRKGENRDREPVIRGIQRLRHRHHVSKYDREGKKGGRGREEEGEEKVEEEKGDEERSKNEERRQRHRREKTGAQSCFGVPLHLQLLPRLNSPDLPESFQ